MDDTTPKRILITNDDPLLFQWLQAMPNSKKIVIETPKDFEGSLDILSRHSFDLVFIDAGKEKTMGDSFWNQLRELQPDTKVIVITSESTATEILEAIKQHVFAFFNRPYDRQSMVSVVANALNIPQWEDGITVLSARPDWIALRVQPRIVTAGRVYSFMKELIADIPDETRDQIATAFRELLMNAIEHGAGFESDQRVDVCSIRTRRSILYLIKDPGEGFSFQNLPHAAISNPDDHPIAHMQYRMTHGLREGGFGLMIVKQLVDEVLYNEAGNEVVMIKYLD
jgi:anti-sigma regulatory factor (Ser/Thr protein kinase)/ActR/RegA family two-component response regulator